MANKNVMGFVIIAGALMVPGAMYYQWHMKQEKARKVELESKVRRNMPADAPIFSAAPSGERLSNPMAGASPSQTPAASTAAVAAAPTQAPAAGLPPAAPVVEPPATVQPAATQTPVAPVASAPATPPVVSTDVAPTLYADGMLMTGAIAQIVLARDPMLSPYDQVRIAEEELRKRRAQEELEMASRPKAVRKQVVQERPAESLVELQGIVSTGDGDKAIVNGEMVSEGDMVGAVKIVKITPTGVVFLYRNKRFIKGISK